jgi:DNA-binding FrmR family transcriptional regulator
MDRERKLDVVNRLKSARGHIDHILAMVDDDAYVLDLLRQVAAVRGALDASASSPLRYERERSTLPGS